KRNRAVAATDSGCRSPTRSSCRAHRRTSVLQGRAPSALMHRHAARHLEPATFPIRAQQRGHRRLLLPSGRISAMLPSIKKAGPVLALAATLLRPGGVVRTSRLIPVAAKNDDRPRGGAFGLYAGPIWPARPSGSRRQV